MGSVSSVRGRLPNEVSDKEVHILTFRDGPDRPADQEGLFKCLFQLKEHLVGNGKKRVAMSRIGCSEGQLHWGKISKMVETAIRVAVYGTKPQMPRETRKPNSNTEISGAGMAPDEKRSEVAKPNHKPRTKVSAETPLRAVQTKPDRKKRGAHSLSERQASYTPTS